MLRISFFLAVSVLLCFAKEQSLDTALIVIVLSRGRSGSTELCNIIGNIVGTNMGKELFGGSSEGMANKEDPLALMQKYLLDKQIGSPGKIVGFKWKPYTNDEKYEKVWKWVAENNVKVVFNYRNPLDVHISVLRLFTEQGHANCQTDNLKCIKTQQAIKVSVNTTSIQSDLDSKNLAVNELLVRLSTYNINYYEVTYEGINNGKLNKRISYVQSMANFIKPGFKVTKDVLETETEFIGHEHQVDEVTNYAELQAALNGTRFWRYLH